MRDTTGPGSQQAGQNGGAAPRLALRIQNVGKTFGAGADRVVAIEAASLDVNDGEFITIVGPSGCGKSTLLQIVAGLVPASEGEILLDGRKITAPPKDMVYLFQQYSKSLFPWLTIEQNICFAFEHRLRLGREEKHERAVGYLKMVGLQDFAAKYPWQLSGGMQQRAAIARALSAEPRVLLMDEPFSSVDALTRLDLHTLILELWTRHRFTVLLVTHDVDEAVLLADKVAVLTHRPSRIAQVIDTELPRPRDPVDTKVLPRFLDLRQSLLRQLLSRPEQCDAQ